MNRGWGKRLFYLLVVLLPVQLGRHFWPPFAFIGGLRSDYLSPTIYITDLFVLGLFALQLKKVLEVFWGSFMSDKRAYFFLDTVIIIANVVFSINPLITLYHWIKFAEIGFLIYWVRENFAEINWKLVIYLFLLQLGTQFFLTVSQFVTQSAIGGIWYLVGERWVTIVSPGAARAVFWGRMILRPAGSFSHPNVLAGYTLLLLSLVLDLTAYARLSKRKISAVAYPLGLVVILLTLSRSSLLLFCLSTSVRAIGWARKNFRVAVKNFSVFLVFGGLVTFGLVVGVLVPRISTIFNVDSESWFFRIKLNELAIKIFLSRPIVGIGLGAFPLFAGPDNRWSVPFSLLYQPVHNVYLLALAETGLLGVIFFGSLLSGLIRSGFLNRNSLSVITVAMLLILGIFDHFLFTQQQTLLLSGVIIGIALGARKNAKI